MHFSWHVSLTLPLWFCLAASLSGAASLSATAGITYTSPSLSASFLVDDFAVHFTLIEIAIELHDWPAAGGYGVDVQATSIKSNENIITFMQFLCLQCKYFGCKHVPPPPPGRTAELRSLWAAHEVAFITRETHTHTERE